MDSQLAFRNLIWLTLVVTLLAATHAEDRPSHEEKNFAPGALGMRVPVITSANRKNIDDYVGRLVAVQGIVSERTKLPDILGVQVKTPDELRGQEAYAVGILGKFTVKQVNPLIANNGPGVKYTLYFDLSGKIAEAQAMPK
jgi:hypothetical protein